jgi:hypothetical protein
MLAWIAAHSSKRPVSSKLLFPAMNTDRIADLT